MAALHDRCSQRPSCPPAGVGRDREPVPSGLPELNSPRHPRRACARDAGRSPPTPTGCALRPGPRPAAPTPARGCAWTPTSPRSPSPERRPGTRPPAPTPADPSQRPGPSTPHPPSPQPASREPTIPGHPSLEPAAPRQPLWVGGSPAQDPGRGGGGGLPSTPHPALLFLRRSLGSLRPGQAELRRRVRARAPLPPEAPRSRARPPRPPRPRRDRRRRKALGRAPRRHPRRTARPPRTSAAFAAPGSALLAGLGRQPRASPRGDAPRHPGPGARALARSLGREARAAAPASQVPSAGSPGGPSPSWPSGQRPGPGGPRAASSQLRTHSGRPNGPGPGPGGPRARYSLQ